MDIDAKHQVLFALYAEYQKDLPDMTLVTFQSLNMDCRVFKVAIQKLQNEGFISGAKFLYADDRISDLCLKGVMLTREGIEYVESKLEIERSLTGREKARALSDKFGKLGWEALIDVAARVLSEMIR